MFLPIPPATVSLDLLPTFSSLSTTVARASSSPQEPPLVFSFLSALATPAPSLVSALVLSPSPYCSLIPKCTYDDSPSYIVFILNFSSWLRYRNIEALEYSVVNWLGEWGKIKYFGAMFDQSIVSRFKVLYLKCKSNRQTTFCITNSQFSSYLYQFAVFQTAFVYLSLALYCLI